jgi:hypothetical protein
MTERVLPTPDAFATCPSDGNILAYYAGTFESVYILFHPFIKPVSIEAEQFSPLAYPDRSSILKNCQPVSWAEVAKLAMLPSMAAVDVGLRTSIGGLKNEFVNQDYARQIDALFESHGIISPPEGFFSDLIHDTVLESIRDLGYQWVWVGDEFGTERKLYWIDDLKAESATATSKCHCNVFTPDKTLLWTTHWDSHFSFLCASKVNLLTIQQRMGFEGFFCTPETDVYWSVRET